MIERIVIRAGLTAVIGPNIVGQRAGGRRLGVALGGIPFRLSGWVSRTLWVISCYSLRCTIESDSLRL